MSNEKVKTGIYIKESSRTNLNNLKDFNKKPSEFMDTILEFDENALMEYIDIYMKYNNNKLTRITKENQYHFTNDKKEVELAQLSTANRIPQIAKANLVIENSINKIENTPQKTAIEEIETLKMQLAKFYTSLSITAQDNMKVKQEFSEIRKLKEELEILKTDYENLIKNKE